MSKNYKEIGSQILSNIGGKENVVSAAHCATRLRLVLKDDSKINVKAIEEMPAVKGNFNTSGQFQIILGSGVVNEVYKELIKMADISEGSKEELKKEADKKLNPVQRLIKSLADVFVPVLPILVAAGTRACFGLAERTAIFLAGTPVVGRLSILVHGKSGFADWITSRKCLRIFRTTRIEGDKCLTIIDRFYSIVDAFYVVALVGKERAFL